MTNEQIKQECAGLEALVSVPGSQPRRLYEQFAYSLLLRAYEEAAQVAAMSETPDQAATSIRALKDPLDADSTVPTAATL